MGGTPNNLDHGQILTVLGDPQSVFNSQHDARFEPGGNISIYDNQSLSSNNASRAVEYHVDTATGKATLVWSFLAPDGLNSSATGSFRRLGGGADNVIGWGVKGNTLFTEVDAAGVVMLDVAFPSGQGLAYRAIKVPPEMLNHNLLRATAGLPSVVRAHAPVVGFVSPASGPGRGGDQVNIMGTGFISATRVAFGSKPAASFTVINDTSISAIAPAGTGNVDVVVTGPVGRSGVTPFNELLESASDASFESGTGSWSSTNSDMAITSTGTRSGSYALRVSPLMAGPVSAIAGQYPVTEGAEVTGNAWVLPSPGTDSAEANISFYDAGGAILATYHGDQTLSGGGWFNLSETGVAPMGSVSVALGIAVASPTGPFNIDEASLSGTPRYLYAL
jgi:hypothetical protein